MRPNNFSIFPHFSFLALSALRAPRRGHKASQRQIRLVDRPATVKDSIRSSISKDYVVNSSNILGRGLNGDVVTAVNRGTGVSFALKTYRNIPSTNTFTNMRYCARECEIQRKSHIPILLDSIKYMRKTLGFIWSWSCTQV